MTTIKSCGDTREQAVRRVSEASGYSMSGNDLAEVLRRLEITASTWQRWRRAHAGMGPNHLKRIKGARSSNDPQRAGLMGQQASVSYRV